MSKSSSHRQHRRFVTLGLVLVLAMLAGCAFRLRPLESIPTVDADATDETKALFIKLWTLASSNQTLFGHMDDLYFGVGWRGEPGRSDVLEVSGSYPAVYGWDVGLIELGGPNNVDGVPFDTMRERIIEGYRRGGVITISWHMSNPVTFDDSDPGTSGDFYDRTAAVSTILPGGSNWVLYIQWLNQFADFAKSLTVSGVPWNEDEHLVPVIFRPFHEHNHGVFWWGRRNPMEPDKNATEEEYIALWRFTVEYLRDVAGVHNLLYAYSPDTRFMYHSGSGGTFADLDEFQRQYFYGYPGDDYVDVLGLDNYSDVQQNRLNRYENSLDMLVQTARDRSDLKIPAFTETGEHRWQETNDTWWTTFLYPALVGTRRSHGQVAWVLVWRSIDEMHHNGPYPGGPSAADFVEFKNRRAIIFEDEIPFNMYTWP